MSGKELDYIKEAFEQNWIAPIGPQLNRFEEEVVKYTGSKYAVAVSSGTAGLHLALKANQQILEMPHKFYMVQWAAMIPEVLCKWDTMVLLIP